MIGPQGESHDRVAEVVPVNDEASSLDSSHKPHHDECWNAGRILHEIEVGSGSAEEEEIEQLEDLV